MLQIQLSSEQVSAMREITARFGVKSVRVFGSRARGESRLESDLDLLVEFAPGASLLDAIGLEQELGDALGVRVQVVTPGSLVPELRERVLTEAVVL